MVRRGREEGDGLFVAVGEAVAGVVGGGEVFFGLGWVEFFRSGAVFWLS